MAKHGENGSGISYPFTPMPRAWIDDATLKAGHKAVLMALLRRAGADGECFPSHADLGRLAGMGASTVRRHLITLRSRGIVHWTTDLSGSKGRRSNSYRITTPRDVATESPGTTNVNAHSEHAQNVGSARLEQGVSLNSSEEIDNKEKEEEPTPSAPASSKQAIDLYYQLYFQRYTERPAIGEKQGKLAKDLVAKVGLDRTLATLRRGSPPNL